MKAKADAKGRGPLRSQGCREMARCRLWPARQNRSQDNDQDCVECGFARKRSFVTKPDHNQRGDEDDNSAEGDLNKGQIFWLDTQTKEQIKEIRDCIHSKNLSREKSPARVAESDSAENKIQCRTEVRFACSSSIFFDASALLSPSLNSRSGDFSHYSALLKSLPQESFCGGNRFGCFVVAGACISQAPRSRSRGRTASTDQINAGVLPFVVAGVITAPSAEADQRLFNRATLLQHSLTPSIREAVESRTSKPLRDKEFTSRSVVDRSSVRRVSSSRNRRSLRRPAFSYLRDKLSRGIRRRSRGDCNRRPTDK